MDNELRKLERRFQQSGSPQDELALLRKQLQTNLITNEQIQIASYLDYPVARDIDPTPITICSILNGTDYADTLSESWYSGLLGPNNDRYDCLFAAMLAGSKEAVGRLYEPNATEELSEDQANYVIGVCNRGLKAAALAFADASFPDNFGFDGQIYHELGAQYRRTKIYFAINCIYSLCEALNAHYLNRDNAYTEEEQRYSELTFYNLLEFFNYEREWLCRRIGEIVVPWILQPDPTSAGFVSLVFNFDDEQ